MDSLIAKLLAELTLAVSFEEAAASTLRTTLDVARNAMRTSAFAKKGRPLRGMVHVRPDDGYRRLAVLQEPDRSGRELPSCAPSTTAWRFVVKHEATVVIDVTLGTVSLGPGENGVIHTAASETLPAGGETLALLRGRETTHVIVLPLRAPGRAIEGMISIEFECRAAVGKDFIWPEVTPLAQIVAQAAAPFLLALPARAPAASEVDELLPIVGEAMTGIVDALRTFARTEETILLSGPTGAGKSRLARWCHDRSPRRAAPLETLDLATVPEELQMGELVGWKRGAFTGASRDTPGCIARAEGGTLFIDEIDKLSLKAQAGLLRLIDERRYRPLGDGAGDKNANVRVVVATNANLLQAVSESKFREDLYYRINVLPIRVPSLAERPDEIARWAAHMLERRHRADHPHGEARFSTGAERALLRYDWPGNLRQLDNIVRRAYALALVGQGGPTGALTIEADHVDRALAYEGAQGTATVIQAFMLAAITFVREAARRRAEGGALDLDLADGIRGLILGAAIERTGNREEAFRALDKDLMVQNRNHTKALRRELERVAELCAAFGVKSPFDKLIEPEDKG